MSQDDRTEAALAALLALIEADREARCRAILAPARQQAEARRAGARAAARRQYRGALELERAQLRVKAERGQALLEAAQHERHRRLARAAVEAGWTLLGPALAARWRDPQLRQRWLDAALAAARARLPAGAWRILHPASLAASETAALADSLARQGFGEIGFEVAAGIEAGIVVCAAGARLDATIAGLLADRAAVSGRLCYLWETP